MVLGIERNGTGRDSGRRSGAGVARTPHPHHARSDLCTGACNKCMPATLCDFVKERVFNCVYCSVSRGVPVGAVWNLNLETKLR
eukprot:3530323-Prymnesium_polylepis.1